jgi:cytochrome o ubiquinol oxidase operon protein cyoD
MSNHHEVAGTQTCSNSKTFWSYLVGFILCAALSIAAAYLVQHHLFDTKVLCVLVTVFLIAQVFVQMCCFFRLNNSSPDSKWDLITFFFTIFITAIIVTGSLWIMFNLNYNMVH